MSRMSNLSTNNSNGHLQVADSNKKQFIPGGHTHEGTRTLFLEPNPPFSIHTFNVENVIFLPYSRVQPP